MRQVSPGFRQDAPRLLKIELTSNQRPLTGKLQSSEKVHLMRYLIW